MVRDLELVKLNFETISALKILVIKSSRPGHILEGIMQSMPYRNGRKIPYFSGKCCFSITNTIFFAYIQEFWQLNPKSGNFCREKAVNHPHFTLVST